MVTVELEISRGEPPVGIAINPAELSMSARPSETSVMAKQTRGSGVDAQAVDIHRSGKGGIADHLHRLRVHPMRSLEETRREHGPDGFTDLADTGHAERKRRAGQVGAGIEVGGRRLRPWR